MSPGPGNDTSGRNILRGVLGVATGKADALRYFGATRQSFLSSLMPLLAVPLLSSVLTQRQPSLGRFLVEILASVCALLVAPVVTHALARAWGREAGWLRMATAFNWCQFALLVVMIIGLFLIGAIIGRGGALMILAGLGFYALWLHWFLARHALGISASRAIGLVLSIHLATSLIVLGPRFVATIIRS